MMAEYPVRCCCQPQKIFGYLELPDGLVGGTRIPVSLPAEATPAGAPSNSHKIEMIELRGCFVFFQEHVAVYSDDRPIEFWRQLPNFRELVPVAGLEPTTGADYDSAALPTELHRGMNMGFKLKRRPWPSRVWRSYIGFRNMGLSRFEAMRDAIELSSNSMKEKCADRANRMRATGDKGAPR